MLYGEENPKSLFRIFSIHNEGLLPDIRRKQTGIG